MSIQSQIQNALIKGDQLLGVDTNNVLVQEAQKRYNELSKHADKLSQEIEKKQKIIERVDRDFSDVNDSLPHPAKNTINVLEDYTIVLLLISYTFMIIAFIYAYTSNSAVPETAFMHAILGSIFVTLGISVLLYYIV